jgi:hypothetical protein
MAGKGKRKGGKRREAAPEKSKGQRRAKSQARPKG